MEEVRLGRKAGIEMKKKGFTLFEILVVVIVLGLLASIAVAKYCWAAEMARDVTARVDMTTLSNQLEFYRIQHGDFYPWEVADVGEDLDLVIEQLTQRTNQYGDVMPEGGNPKQYRYGPYLDKFPTYLFSNSPGGEVTFDDVICYDDEPEHAYGDSASPPSDGSGSGSGSGSGGGMSVMSSPPSGGGGSSTTSSSNGRGRLRDVLAR